MAGSISSGLGSGVGGTTQSVTLSGTFQALTFPTDGCRAVKISVPAGVTCTIGKDTTNCTFPLPPGVYTWALRPAGVKGSGGAIKVIPIS